MPATPPRAYPPEAVLVRRRNLAAAAAVFFLILIVGTGALDELTSVNEDRSFPAGPAPRVVIHDGVGRGLRGGLEVRAGGPDRIHVKGKVHGTWRVRYVLEQRGRDVVIDVQPLPFIGWLGFLGPARFVVTAPAATEVEIETSHAPIEIQGITGGGVVRTTNGPIRLVGGGGHLTATTTNGPIAVEGFDGTAELRSTNGPIEVQASRGAFDAETTNGPIALEADLRSGAHHRAESTNGGIAVRLRGEPSLRIDAQSSNGPVSARRPLNDTRGSQHGLAGTIGSGAGELSLRSVNGPIAIE